MVVVVVVVVVVRTGVQRRMFIHDDARDAPNYGGRVPVDYDPRPCTCVQRPENSPHQLIAARS